MMEARYTDHPSPIAISYFFVCSKSLTGFVCMSSPCLSRMDEDDVCDDGDGRRWYEMGWWAKLSVIPISCGCWKCRQQN